MAAGPPVAESSREGDGCDPSPIATPGTTVGQSECRGTPCIRNHAPCSHRSVKRTAMQAQDTPGLRALGSRWARLLDNLPGVSHLCRCAGCLSSKTHGDKKTALAKIAQPSNRVRQKMEKKLELDQDTYNEYVPVSSTDELSSDGGLAADRTRKLGEFSQTNSPLSVDEIKKRKTRGWGVIWKTRRT